MQALALRVAGPNLDVAVDDTPTVDSRQCSEDLPGNLAVRVRVGARVRPRVRVRRGVEVGARVRVRVRGGVGVGVRVRVRVGALRACPAILRMSLA